MIQILLKRLLLTTGLCLSITLTAQSKFVGVTAGTADVSSTGAATYQIPLVVSPGIAGMQPNLSITYNSQVGNGLLGYGFTLTGLSSITRIVMPYPDGGFKTINLDASDTYALDGQRLYKPIVIPFSGSVTHYGRKWNNSYGDYYTEYENFSKIEAHGATGYGPIYFTVTTKEGMVMEYGATADSRVVVIGTDGKERILEWKLNKITDPVGRYITYNYFSYNNNVVPCMIAYTGTTNMGPSDFIRLDYQTAEGYNSQYQAGVHISRANILLKNVYISHNGDSLRRYIPRYEKDHLQYRMTTLEEHAYASSKEKVKLITTFKWEQKPGVNGTMEMPDNNVRKIYLADLDGDGKDEMIKLYNNSSIAKFFKLNGLNQPIYCGEVNLMKTNAYMQFADVNGDGLNDIMIAPVPFIDSKGVYDAMSMNYGIYHRIFINNGNFHFTFSLSSIDGWSVQGGVGNYSGTGKMEATRFYNMSRKFLDRVSYNGSQYNTASTELSAYIGGVRNIGDFNGDGKDDILLYDKNKYIRSFIPNEKAEFDNLNVDVNDILGDAKALIHGTGDFNGDGKTDVLLWHEVDKVWRIYYATGVGYSEPYIPDGLEPKVSEYHTERGTRSINSDHKTYVCDLNGDGKADILEVGCHSTSGNLYERVCRGHFSSGIFNQFTTETKRLPQSTDYANATVAYVNGDGRPSIFIPSDLNSFGTWYTFDANAQTYVGTITDNMGMEQKFDYITLPKQYNGTIPNIGLGAPLRVVGSMYSSNAVGGYNEVKYTFEEPKTNVNRKAFFGFAKVTAENVTQNAKTISLYEYHNLLGLLPHTSNVYVGNQHTNYSYQENLTTEISYRGIPMIQVRNTTVSNKLTGNIKTVNYTYNNYGNVTSEQCRYNSGQLVTETAYSNWVTSGSFIPHLPQTTTTLSNYGGLLHRDTSTTLHDIQGRPRQVVAKGVTTTYEYHPVHGQTTKITTTASDIASPRVQEYAYDDMGLHVLRATTGAMDKVGEAYGYNTLGLLTSITDAIGRRTLYTYDALGREVTRTLPNGTTITTQRERVADTEDAAYSIFTFGKNVPSVKTYYDLLGREVKNVVQGKGNKYITTQQKYNSRGLLEKVITPNAQGGTQEVSYEYDEYGRIAREVSPHASMRYTYSGNTITTTNESTSRNYTRTTNVLGQVATTTDASGTVAYTYNAQRLPSAVSVTTGGQTVTTSMGYNARGQQTSLSDPTSTTIYKYNALGELLKQIDAVGNTITTTYDEHGRIYTRTLNATTYTYRYKGTLLSRIEQDGRTVHEYEYKENGLLDSKTEYVDKQKLIYKYSYNTQEQLTATTYPSGLKIDYEYDITGHLTTIAEGTLALWRYPAYNSTQQLEAYSLGNNTKCSMEYTKEGLLKNVSILNPQGVSMHTQNYAFNVTTGNLTSRTFDGITERFEYDHLDRLTACRSALNAGSPTILEYSPNGNIETKTYVGTFEYNETNAGRTANPYAITSLNTSIDTLQTQLITYNALGKVATIAQGTDSVRIGYDHEGQRNKMEHYRNSRLLRTHYYSGLFERQVEADGTSRDLTYISAESGIFAVHEKPNQGSTLWWYLHPDHLGSPTLITDKLGQQYEQHRYDAWGQRLTPQGRFSRGYTGHEHLATFGLINMNGRVYDPMLGRMLSPDPYVADAGYTQDFNRYSYARNNPLMYTDPSGEFIWIIPNIGWSKQGGLSLGLSVVFGIPGIASAQVGGGYNFGSNDAYAYAGATACFNTAAVSYSTSGGWSVGYTAGLSPFSGVPISTNFATVGFSYNMTHNVPSANFSAWYFDAHGTTFNPSISTMIAPERTTNLVRGQGFKTNDQVLSNFLAADQHQKALDYFGFEGRYGPDHPHFREHPEAAAIHDNYGNIFYSNDAFNYNYDRLAFYADHERIHGQHGTRASNNDYAAIGKEEWNTYMQNYKRQGLYRNFDLPISVHLGYYGRLGEIYAPTSSFQPQWWHRIYKIPRLW